MEIEKADIGIYGLAVMGQNLALNIASHGFKVAVSNRSANKIESTIQRGKEEGNLPIVGYENVMEFVESLKVPRKVIILVMAGKPVDDTIQLLAEHMQPGDIIIDGGNEWFPNTVRRGNELMSKEIHYLGMGISGGEEGARNGPSIMPGGPKEAFDAVENILRCCAAQVSDGPCTTYLGPGGAGNYVKMVHNGIEYGDMQLIAEIYDILRYAAGLSNEEISQVFLNWNTTELESFLVEITGHIMSKKDDLIENDKSYLVDSILDKTGMKGTGRWTVQEAAERNVPCPTIAAALDMRYISGRKEERVASSSILRGPNEIPSVEKSQIIEDCKSALYCAKICSYAQGMCLIKAASDEFKWDINLAECARIWKGGCIIRASLLDRIKNAFLKEPTLPNLLVSSDFSLELNRRQNSWRRIVSLCVAAGIASPALSASLSYFDSYRRERLPANLTQAQRDYFGGHSYERVDRTGQFHAHWTAAHHDIGNVNERIAGNK